jgi:hypothetical protein
MRYLKMNIFYNFFVDCGFARPMQLMRDVEEVFTIWVPFQTPSIPVIPTNESPQELHEPPTESIQSVAAADQEEASRASTGIVKKGEWKQSHRKVKQLLLMGNSVVIVYTAPKPV